MEISEYLFGVQALQQDAPAYMTNSSQNSSALLVFQIRERLIHSDIRRKGLHQTRTSVEIPRNPGIILKALGGGNLDVFTYLCFHRRRMSTLN